MAARLNAVAGGPRDAQRRRVVVCLSVGLVAVALLATGAPARAAPELVDASSNNFPPVNLRDRDGELTGFGRDLSEAVVRAVGGTVTHIHSPIWTEVLKWLDDGRADFIHDTGYTPERTTFLDYSEPILRMPEEIFVRTDRFDLMNLESLYGKRVACVNEHITHLYLKKIPEINCVTVKTPPEGVRALVEGRVDALIYPRQIVHYYAYKMGVASRVKAVGEPLRTLTWHMVVKKGNAETLLLLNRGIAKVKASGEYDRIYDRWFGRTLNEGYSARQVAYLVAVILALAAMAGLLVFLLTRMLRREVRTRTSELSESEKRFRDVAEIASDWIWETDPALRFTWLSPRFEELTGLSPDYYLGRAIDEMGPPDDNIEGWAQMLRDIDARRPLSGYSYARMFPDGKQRHLMISAKPLFDSEAEFLGYRGTGRDITAQVHAEEQLRQAQKMEAVGHLTGGIAHDFNNILTVLSGNLELMGLLEANAQAVDRKSLSELRESAMRATARGSRLAHRLLAFARKQPLNPEEIDVGSVINEMDGLIRSSANEEIDIRISCSERWRAFADPSQLENALLNLVINARDAMPEGGTLTIESADGRFSTGHQNPAGQAANGDCVTISVTDTGIGIPPEQLGQVFEPFFTTKPLGQGSGLGLSMVHGFAKQSGGTVDIESEVGKGTTVRIALPRAADVGASANDFQLRGTGTGLDGHGEVVLLVEDDAAVRDATRVLIEALGYVVLTAEDGPSALVNLARSPQVDLILTDMVMPHGLTGPQLARRAREMRPGVGVICMSGHIDNRLDMDDPIDRQLRLIRKPFTMDELAAELRDALRG